MPERDRDEEFEVADTESVRREAARDERTGRSAAAARIAQQASWVDLQVRQAMERGEFDNLPGQGKPIEDLGVEHDPDWWVKKLVEREHIALLPPALALRKEDAELEDRLDAITVEREVRRELEDFNKRVVETRRQLQGGPPVVTATRDVDTELAAWRDRRTARIEAQRAVRAAGEEPPAVRSWWRRLTGR